MNQGDDRFIQAIRPLFKERSIYQVLTVLSVAIILILAGIGDGWEFLGVLLVLPSMIFPLMALSDDFRLERKVWEQFAKQLDSGDATFAYHQPDHLQGVMRSLGFSLHLDVLASGTIGTRAVRVLRKAISFNPYSMRSYDRWYRIVEISSRQDFYHVFMSSKKNQQPFFPTAMTLLSRSIRNNQKLSVEGDVDKYFDIYAPEGSNWRGLVTLTPDKLLALREYGTKFDIEFVGSSIYVISSNRLRSIKDVLIYQQEALDLISNIGVDLALDRDAPQRELVITTPGRLPFN